MKISFASAAFVFLILATFLFGACQSESKSPLFNNLEKLAQEGNPEAQYHLGMMYNNGIGVRQDPKEAFAWFISAADSGEPLASYKVGCYYAGQFGVVPFDGEKALQYKLIAANEGYSFAQADVGNIYFQKANFDEAIKWWKLAAAQGYRPALGNLSLAYNEGKIVPPDKALAYAYYKLANMDREVQLSADSQQGLSKLAEAMTSYEVVRAEKLVSDWRPQLTPLTTRAETGMHDADRVVEGGRNNH